MTCFRQAPRRRETNAVGAARSRDDGNFCLAQFSGPWAPEDIRWLARARSDAAGPAELVRCGTVLDVDECGAQPLRDDTDITAAHTHLGAVVQHERADPCEDGSRA